MQTSPNLFCYFNNSPKLAKVAEALTSPNSELFS